MKFDLHTHYYPESFFDKIRELSSDFTFDKDPTGRTIIKLRGARFFGITPPMTDPEKRIEDMDRVGIDVEVVSLSTPNVFFAPAERQPEVARMVNDDYAELIARYPKRFKGFASIPMDDPDEAVKELHRALDKLKLNGVILISNIQGRSLTSPQYRAFFEEANRRNLCIGCRSDIYNGVNNLQAHYRWYVHRMRYAALKEQGLPIGSGVTEAACKTLATQRMKRSGMRWGEQGGQAILSFRALVQSNRFERAWTLLAHTYKAEVTTLDNVVPIRSWQ